MNMQLVSGRMLRLAMASLALMVSGTAFAQVLYVVNSQSRTLSRVDIATETVNNSFATLGNVPNKVVVDAEHIWAVNSGDNAIQKISRASGATLQNILVAPGSNPWDACRHQDNLYVTGLFTGKVYRIDTLSGTVTGAVNVGTAPEGLLTVGDKLYVTNSGNYAQNYAGSSVSVISLPGFELVTTIPVNANPQYLAYHNGMLHVSCTGNWMDIGGAVCIIDPDTDTLVHTIEMGGTPGCIWIADSSTAYVGDGGGVHLYSYDPGTFQLLNGSANPLPNGGSEIVGTPTWLAILSPNWSGNGTVKVLHPDLSLWKQFSVGLMPMDMKLDHQQSDADDPLAPQTLVSVWPNPARPGARLDFVSREGLDAELRIYNLRGQQLTVQPFTGKKASLPAPELTKGIYLYRLVEKRSGKTISGGKFTVM